VEADGRYGWLPWGAKVGLKQEAFGTVKVSIRPEDIKWEATDSEAYGVVETAVFMGSSVTYRVLVGSLLVRAMASGNETDVIAEGRKVRISVPQVAHVLLEEPEDETASGTDLLLTEKRKYELSTDRYSTVTAGTDDFAPVGATATVPDAHTFIILWHRIFDRFLRSALITSLIGSIGLYSPTRTSSGFTFRWFAIILQNPAYRASFGFLCG